MCLIYSLSRTNHSALKSALAHHVAFKVSSGDLEQFLQGENIHMPSGEETVTSKIMNFLYALKLGRDYDAYQHKCCSKSLVKLYYRLS